MFGNDALTSTNFRRLLESCALSRRGLQVTRAVIAAAWLATPTIAHAAIIDYVFSNASAVFDGIPETINGVFTVSDSALGLGIEYYANIQLTGAAPYSGLYSLPVSEEGQPLLGKDIVIATGPAGSLQIRFADNLSSTNDPLASVEISNNVTDTAPTGAVGVAGPIQYKINGSTVLNGTPETISGFFTFDPFSLLQYGEISLTGGPPYAQIYPFDLRLSAGKSASSISPDRLIINFVNDLSLATDPIASVVAFGPFPPFAVDNAPMGFACPGSAGVGPCPAPEPTSLAILGAAIGLFLLSLRPSRRPRQLHPI